MYIPTAENTKTITDLREKAVELLAQIKRSGPAFIFHHSEPKAVMLSIEEYANLMEMLEDHFDTIKAGELEENPQKGGISLKGLTKKYRLNI